MEAYFLTLIYQIMESYTYLGIDVSKDFLDIAYKKDDKWHEKRLPNELKSLAHWLNQWKDQRVCLVYEYTGVYHDKLLNLAEEAQIPHTLVNPKKSYYFMQLEGHTHRNDRQAARSLAAMGAQQLLQPYQFTEGMKRQQQRKQVQMALEALLGQRQALKNRLHALAQLYKPNEKAKEALEKALEVIEEQIEELEQELRSEITEEEEELSKLISSVVGIGPKSTQSLLTYIGDFSRFESHKQLLKFVGVVPQHHQSGSSVRKKARISKQGPATLRATLYMAARAAKKHNFACKELYTRLRKKGKPHKKAMIAVVAKLLKQVFAVVSSGVPFDNKHYLKYEKN